MSQGGLLEKLKRIKDVRDINNPSSYTSEDFLEAMTLKSDVLAQRFLSLIDRQVMSRLEISVTNARVLFAVKLLGETTQTELLKYIYTSAANLSQRVDWLSKKGYLTILSGEQSKDRRKKKLKITKKGSDKADKIIKESAKFKQKWVKHFTKEELIQVTKFCMKISKLLDEIEKREK